MADKFVMPEKKFRLVFILSLFVLTSMLVFISNVMTHDNINVYNESGTPTLVIDAGHGGIDGGAIGADGSRESDINLDLAHKLYSLCDFFAVNAVMTRNDDSRGANALTYSEHKELVYRAELVNSIDNAVLISIHQNCFPTAQPSGPQVIYSNNNCSRELGTTTHNNLISCLDPTSRRLPEPDKNDIYVLSNVNCPAILVECGFVSNHSDITKLRDPSYQIKLSTILLASYVQFLNNENRV